MQKIQVQLKDGYYSCDIGISKEEWLTILKDRGTSDKVRETLLCFYYMPGHKGSCTAVGKKMGKKASSLNMTVSQFGIRIKKLFKDQFEVYGTDGKPTYWIIPMNNGKGLSGKDDGAFEWELRKELAEAIHDYLYWYLVEQYKKIRQEIPINHDGRGYEIYKWQLITSSKGKSPIQILSSHVAHSGKAALGGFENLIDASRDNKLLKYLITEKTEEYEAILNRLASEEIPLNERLLDFKNTTVSLLPEKGYNSKANDERTAATILTCLNPDKYTFYKHDGLYANFCKYLGVDMQKAGLCYSHYLTLIQPLVEIVGKDDELQELIAPFLSGMRESNLLLAQDILWVMMVTFQSRLGYIYNLLFNTENNMDKSKINEYIELIEANHNLILTGAPGTGKTYLAKQIAIEMLNLKDIEELDGNEQFGFVQFHPSYDYTDFVEGIRPRFDGNEGFELRDGVFKKFCANAIVKYETKDFDVAFDNLIATIGDSLLKLKTPQGSEFGVSVNSRGNLKLHTGEEFKEQGVLTRDSIKSQFAGMPVYKYWRGYYEGVVSHLKENYNLQQTENDPNKKYIFVIDEINRGEISKILGELFFSIDPGYRGTNGQVKTQYANMAAEPNEFDAVLGTNEYGNFFVPENVYIIGTMNDIDRSVESMDFAMRRRFAWKEVTAEDSIVMLDNNDKLIEVGAPIDEIKARMRHLNAAIIGKYKYKDGKEKKIQGLSQSFQIGAAYFLKYANYAYSDDAFGKLWEYHLKGLLAEYLRGNAEAEKELELLKESYNDNGTNSNNGQQPGETKPEGTGEDSAASA